MQKPAKKETKQTVTVYYKDPLGMQTQIMDADAQLKHIIFASNNEYWKRGSGNGDIRFKSGKLEAALGLHLKDPYGIHLTHTYLTGSPDDDMYVSISDKPLDKKTSLFLGGDFFLFPLGFFVPRKQAWNAILDFMQSGERSEMIKWMKHSDYIELRDDDDDDDDDHDRIHGKAY